MSNNPLKYALVVFPLPLYTEFAYKIPPELKDQIKTGMIVSAPFRNGIKTGYITGFTGQKPPGVLKEVQDLLFEEPVFRKDLIDLAKWMSGYYFTSPGDIFQVMLPVKIHRESVEIITLCKPVEEILEKVAKSFSAQEEAMIRFISGRKKVTPKLLKQEFGYKKLYYMIDKFKRNGLISVTQTIKGRQIAPKTAVYYKPAINLSAKKQDEVFKNSPAQKEVYGYVLKHNSLSRKLILQKFPGKEAALKALLQKELIAKFDREITREYLDGDSGSDKSLPELTAKQREIVETIDKKCASGEFRVYLLHGVTGSGKTRVYFELIQNTLNRGKSALFMLPEIALTNYFLASLRAIFGETVAVIHSRMSPGERYDSWRAVLSGKKRLVIGPRSAVFAPVDNLGLVIVDEEHDSSYKQYESPPYYHARDVAVYRASLKKAVAVLGSATPGMESYFNAREGKYELLELPERIAETPLPEVKLIDMSRKKDAPESGKRPIFSAELLNELLNRLGRNEQALIMQNRRGFSTFVQCNDCGHIETCPDCRITLTFHKKSYKIQCHFCGYAKPPPVFCPECGVAGIRYSGTGTQKVEEALAEQAPGYRTIRMDQDTTRSKSAHRQITSNFEQGESDIMVGTQMIAKGFDFGRVNLVGIISADTGLFLPEFRAAEKTFQLMTQAAGRAGRRKERGLVLIQTLHPEHYSLKAAAEHDYKGFYEMESVLRAELNYPPHGRIILLRFFGKDEHDVINAASDVGNMLHKSKFRQIMLGPAPAPIEKIKKMYRWQIFLKSGKSEDRNGRKIREAAGLARNFFDSSPHKSKSAMTIDVDPVNLL